MFVIFLTNSAMYLATLLWQNQTNVLLEQGSWRLNIIIWMKVDSKGYFKMYGPLHRYYQHTYLICLLIVVFFKMKIHFIIHLLCTIFKKIPSTIIHYYIKQEMEYCEWESNRHECNSTQEILSALQQRDKMRMGKKGRRMKRFLRRMK